MSGLDVPPAEEIVALGGRGRPAGVDGGVAARLWLEYAGLLEALGYNVTLGEDFKKPDYTTLEPWFIRWIVLTHVELISLNALQVNGNRVFAWLFIVDIARPM